EDRGVDARDFDREFGTRGGPRVAFADANEEVRREEGAEDHHLGDDEKQHPEHLRLRARRAVRGRRMIGVVVGVRGAVGDARGLHGYARAPAGAGATSMTMCSTGTGETPRTRSIRCARSHPERSSGSVEMSTSSTL